MVFCLQAQSQEPGLCVKDIQQESTPVRLREDCFHPPSAEHQDSLRLGLLLNRQNRTLNERQTDFLVDNNKANDSQDPKYSYHQRSCGGTAFACSMSESSHTHTHSPAHHGTVLLPVGTQLRHETREGGWLLLMPVSAPLPTHGLFHPEITSKRGLGGSRGCSSVGRVLTFHAQSLGFDPQHSVNQAWWHVSGMPALGR